MKSRLLTLLVVILAAWVAETVTVRAAHLLAETGRAIAGAVKP